MEFVNIFVLLLVVGSRLIVPLFIPRYPLPAIILCLVIDAVDQTIFQTFTTLNLNSYQSYDKALDIYYLSIAYLSTFKNWTNKAAFQISQFLFYYRMFGNALFELTGERLLLFIFPNTFEYFFIFYSVLALKYDMRKFSTKFFLVSAAFIWIFIKLPQEYWIHIAKLDTTDLISYVISNYLNFWAGVLFAIAVVLISILIYRGIKYIRPRMPKFDYDLRFEFNEKIKRLLIYPTSYKSLIKSYKKQIFEKIIFVTLISIIFASVFPSFNPRSIEILTGVSFIIVVNSFVGYLILKSNRVSIDLIYNFAFVLFVNVSIGMFYIYFLLGRSGIGLTNFLIVLLLSYLLTLITFLYDKYYPEYGQRFKASQK